MLPRTAHLFMQGWIFGFSRPLVFYSTKKNLNAHGKFSRPSKNARFAYAIKIQVPSDHQLFPRKSQMGNNPSIIQMPSRNNELWNIELTEGTWMTSTH